MKLFVVSSKSSCEADHEWAEKFRSECKCPGCGARKRECLERPIDVRLNQKPDISALNTVMPVSVSIVRTDFLNLFADEAPRWFLIGRVLDATGCPVEGFASYVGRKRLIIRGGPESTRRTCDVCGRFVYCPLGSWYVMRSSLTGQPLYEGEVANLVLTEEMRMRIDRKRWKGIYVCELPVRDEPLDGISDFPDEKL